MFFSFDPNSSVPLFRQLRNQVICAISHGELHPGDHLPTIRKLAEDHELNMMTVSKAYQQLAAEGYILTDRRSGAVVAERSVTAEAHLSRENAEELELFMAELKLHGISDSEILVLCRQLLSSMK